jgi:hypothetical protein
MQLVNTGLNRFLDVETEEHRCEMTDWSGYCSGRVEYCIVVRNRSSYVAYLPFLCITDFGLNVRPANGWRLDRIATRGRKILRFMPAKSLCLKPTGTAAPCLLDINWRFCDGMLTAMDPGNGQLNSLPAEIGISVMTGAANIPVEKKHLLIRRDVISEAAERAVGASGDFEKSHLPSAASQFAIHAPPASDLRTR